MDRKRWLQRRWDALTSSWIRLPAILAGIAFIFMVLTGSGGDVAYILLRITGLVLVFDLLRTRRV